MGKAPGVGENIWVPSAGLQCAPKRGWTHDEMEREAQVMGSGCLTFVA